MHNACGHGLHTCATYSYVWQVGSVVGQKRLDDVASFQQPKQVSRLLNLLRLLILQYNVNKNAFEINWLSVSTRRQFAEIEIRGGGLINGTYGKVPDSV